MARGVWAPGPNAHWRRLDVGGSVIRTGEAGEPKVLATLQRPGHLYRGMTEREYLATVGAGRGVQSSRKYSLAGEGTSFAADIADAESYVDFGRDDPRTTGRPNYLIEVKQSESFLKNRQGYYEARDVVSRQSVTRAWRVNPVGSTLVAEEIQLPRSVNAAIRKAVGR